MKILIVGAGPIGCYTARLLAKSGGDMDVRIIEEHSEIGRPVHCAGLVSQEVLTHARFPIDPGCIVNQIDGAELCYNGDSFKINRKDVAVVIDRERFDRFLGEGLSIDFNTRFMGLEKEGSGYLVETDKGEYYADIVIGADGANSAMRKAAGFSEQVSYLRGVQFRLHYDRCETNLVQVYLSNPLFVWIIPESKGIVRVGVLSHNPYHDLLTFLKEKSIDGEILEKFAGIAPMGRCLTSKDRLFLVGDAACQVKPLTQGGIYYGMRCAEILTDCILANKMNRYERQWQERFGREIDIGLKVRQMYQQLKPDTMAKIFSVLKKNSSLLEEFGDFENHSKFISAIFRTSGLQSILGVLIANIIKDIDI